MRITLRETVNRYIKLLQAYTYTARQCLVLVQIHVHAYKSLVREIVDSQSRVVALSHIAALCSRSLDVQSPSSAASV